MEQTEINIEIVSKVNEVFASTKVIQNLINKTGERLDLDISINKNKDNIIFR